MQCLTIQAGDVRLGDRVRLAEDVPEVDLAVIVVRVTRPRRGIVSLWHPDRTIEIEARLPVRVERRDPRVVYRPSRPIWERAA